MKKILVVDDNTAFTELVEMVFSGEYEVLKAPDGQEGLRMAQTTHPDVILLDVMMPKVSGLEMLRQLQADPETRAIPIIVLTASHFDPSTQGMFKEEPNVLSFLRKPCGIEMMRSQIQLALQRREQNNP
ncbi:MAG: response regulator [Elusimicrobiota bacterium]|jgi:putative two-component system response regulator